MSDIQYLYDAIKKDKALHTALLVSYEKLQNAKDSNARAYA